ncbi:alpha/beta fold hydrolase [Phenylobacterium sp. J367]|uniref:alpha/beta fold hydrolase n=1 Tax=Phenylobacterium sp. J367 TaxID=2898435 RepID=UPI002150D66E|nr:alpha/beta hydrolase [Phenylobacterium sp. J367]MCR5879828.1 alpha/beta hydrolase [Phenylobacterium sp. J367]
MAEVLTRRIELPARGGAIAAYEIGPADRPIDLVFSHANGFNARTYLSILAPVAATRRILLPDIRGHGRTALPADPAGRADWTDARDDLLALLDVLDLGDVTLAGHSMGATVSLLAAAEAPARVRDLVLFEPVIMPAGATGGAGRLADGPGHAEAPRRLRQPRGGDPGLYRARGLPVLDAADARRLRRRRLPRRGGRVGDARRRPGVGSIPTTSPRRTTCGGALSAIQAPVRIFRAEKGSTVGATPQELQAIKPGLGQEVVPETTHFLPMERPNLVIAALSG